MKNLAHLAFKSENSLGRALSPKFDRDQNLYFMDPFLLDLMKIQQSKALRRMRGKTQVISAPSNINIRDRMTHSFEVASNAVQTGARLGLNVPLLQAGALAHDLGHVPFGHLGERLLTERLKEKFRHEKFAIFVLEMVERNGRGLNLSYETLQTIRRHSRGSGLMMLNGDVLEYDVVMICDKFYIFSDYNDVRRINYQNLPSLKEIDALGKNQSERTIKCLQALWKESLEKQKISFEDSAAAKLFKEIRNLMYEKVYFQIDMSPERVGVGVIFKRVFDYLEGYFESTRAAALCFALSSENDIYHLNDLISNYGKKVIDENFQDKTKFSVVELLGIIPELAKLDFCNPDRLLDKNNFGKLSKRECFTI